LLSGGWESGGTKKDRMGAISHAGSSSLPSIMIVEDVKRHVYDVGGDVLAAKTVTERRWQVKNTHDRISDTVLFLWFIVIYTFLHSFSGAFGWEMSPLMNFARHSLLFRNENCFSLCLTPGSRQIAIFILF
jgi:hypothetical protein